jgi:hypothetical protein
MGVVEAKIQTVEDIYRLIWTAVANKQPISAIYKERPRLFCPHRLGRNRASKRRVLCYQYGGDSESGLEPAGSPANWRCVALEKLWAVKLLEGSWKQRQIIPVRPTASQMRISMRRINQSAIRKRDSEESAPAGSERESFSG